MAKGGTCIPQRFSVYISSLSPSLFSLYDSLFTRISLPAHPLTMHRSPLICSARTRFTVIMRYITRVSIQVCKTPMRYILNTLTITRKFSSPTETCTPRSCFDDESSDRPPPSSFGYDPRDYIIPHNLLPDAPKLFDLGL